MPPVGYDIRLVLDEDVPERIAGGLRDRGVQVVTVNELRDSIVGRRGDDEDDRRISDDEVCQEVSGEPSVLVSLNLRDYADLASIQALAIKHGVSVVAVRVPKAESRRGQRPAAIADIVHRHLPRIMRLYGGEPQIASANRSRLRVRPASDILAGASAEAVTAPPRADKSDRRRRGRRQPAEPPGAGTLDVNPST